MLRKTCSVMKNKGSVNGRKVGEATVKMTQRYRLNSENLHGSSTMRKKGVNQFSRMR